MLKRMSFGFGALLALAPATCTRPSNETSVASQKQANWLKVDPTGLASAKELPPPKILPETYFAAGQLLEAQGQFADAVGQYQRAVLLNHEYVAAYHRLGLLLGRLNRHREATVALARASELRPDEPVILNNLGFEHAVLGEWEVAQTHLRRAVELSPRFDRAHINLAMVLSQQHRFDDALQEFRAVLPEPQACYNLGLMYCGAKRYRDAGLAFHRALKLDPSLVAAQTQLALIESMSPEGIAEPMAPSSNADAVASALTGDQTFAVADDDDNVFAEADATAGSTDETAPCDDEPEASSSESIRVIEPSNDQPPANQDVAAHSDADAAADAVADGDEPSDLFPLAYVETSDDSYSLGGTPEPCGEASTDPLDDWVAEFMRSPSTIQSTETGPDDATPVQPDDAGDPHAEDETAHAVTADGIIAEVITMVDVVAEASAADAPCSNATPIDEVSAFMAPVVDATSTLDYEPMIDVEIDADAWLIVDESDDATTAHADGDEASCPDLPYAMTIRAVDGIVHKSSPRAGQKLADRHGRARRIARSAAPVTTISGAWSLGAEPMVEVAWDDVPPAIGVVGDDDCIDVELAAAADALDAWASANVTTSDFMVPSVASPDETGESWTAEPMALTGLIKAPRPRRALPHRAPWGDPAGPEWGRSAEAVDARLEDPDGAGYADERGDADDPCPDDVPPGPLMTDRAERAARIENPEPQP